MEIATHCLRMSHSLKIDMSAITISVIGKCNLKNSIKNVLIYKEEMKH